MSIEFGKMRQSIDSLFARYGISETSLRGQYVLERIDEAVKKMEEKSPALASQLDLEAYETLEEIEMAAALKSHLLPGVYRRLYHLRKSGIHLAIATRNCRKALEKVLGKAKIFFEVILTRENSHAFKPEGAALYPILNRFCLPNAHVFMIGDHPLDILTAHHAGIRSIAVMTGTGKKGDLIKAGATYIFKHVNQAIDALIIHQMGITPFIS